MKPRIKKDSECEPKQRESKMGKQLKDGLTLHTHVSHFSGETIYTICDNIGAVYTTIFESRLARFYK